jgi:geranylgeranyl pyrophosphate synthase
MCDIYSFGLTLAISSLCKDNRRHQTTLMDHSALRRTSPTAHYADDLLVMIVRLMFVKLVILMFVLVLMSVKNL